MSLNQYKNIGYKPVKIEKHIKRNPMKSTKRIRLIKLLVLLGSPIQASYYAIQSHGNNLQASLSDPVFGNIPADDRYGVGIWVKTPTNVEDSPATYWSIDSRLTGATDVAFYQLDSGSCDKLKANSWAFILVLYKVKYPLGPQTAYLERNRYLRIGGNFEGNCADCGGCNTVMDHLMLNQAQIQNQIVLDYTQKSFTVKNIVTGFTQDDNNLRARDASVWMAGGVAGVTDINFIGFTGSALEIRLDGPGGQIVDQVDYWKRMTHEGVHIQRWNEAIKVSPNQPTFKSAQRNSRFFSFQGSYWGIQNLANEDYVSVRVPFTLSTTPYTQLFVLIFRFFRETDGIYYVDFFSKNRYSEAQTNYQSISLGVSDIVGKVFDFSVTITTHATEEGRYWTYTSYRAVERGTGNLFADERFILDDTGLQTDNVHKIEDELADIKIQANPWSNVPPNDEPYKHSILEKVKHTIRSFKIVDGGFSDFESKESLQAASKGFTIPNCLHSIGGTEKYCLDCFVGYYWDGVTKSCKPCTLHGCLQCKDETTCLKCEAPASTSVSITECLYGSCQKESLLPESQVYSRRCDWCGAVKTGTSCSCNTHQNAGAQCACSVGGCKIRYFNFF